MINRLIKTFIQYPFYANMLIFVFLIGGMFSYVSLKKSFFPETVSRDIIATVAYPGASPKEMEEGITARIEEAVRSIVGIKEINSTSSENFARVNITTTGEYDIDVTVQEVKNAIDGISSFPSAAERPIIYKRRNTSMAMFLGLSGDNVDLQTLKDYAEEIEDDLRASGVVSQVNIGGHPDLEISIEIKENDLLRYNITFADVAAAISRNNIDISAGQIKSKDEEILIRSRKRSVNPYNIGEIILRANPDGSYLRIRDIARVQQQFADVPNRTLMNGKRSLSINVMKLVEEDLQEISEYVNNYIDEFNASHEGVKIYKSFEFLKVLKSRLSLLYSNGGVGLLLVLVTLGLFLNTRLSFWVAFGIPISFLAMFIVAAMSDITINMISLFGMILVIGILVDDGIVIAENIFAHFERGKRPKQAAYDGTVEVMPAVLTSIATTIVAFAPLMFLKEGGFEFFFEMAFVVIFSLFFSLFEAFLVLPSHIGTPHVLRSGNRTSVGNTIRAKLNKGVDYMRINLYGKLLRRVIRWRWPLTVVPLALILITVGLFKGTFIQATFFPVVQFDRFSINVAFTPGTGEAKTMETLKLFEEAVWEVGEDLNAEFADVIDEIDDKDPIIKYTYLSIGSAFDGVESGSHAGNIFVNMRDLEGLNLSGYEVANRVREKIGPVKGIEKYSVGGGNRFGAPVSLSLLGKDLTEIEQAEVFIMDRLHEFDELQDINNTNAAGKREILLELKPKAYFLGLDYNSISTQVRQGFFGGQAQRLQEGKDELRVWVRYPKEDRMFVGQLDNMMIKTAQGNYPLSELVNYKIERGPVSIKRFNMHREVRIEADLVDPYAPVPPIIEKINQQVLPELKAKFPGVAVEFQGQQRRGQESMAEMMQLFAIAFMIMAMIIMIHFKSTWQALIIIMMIPLAWMGAAWGHGIESAIRANAIPISMLSAFGMVALSGVIINDAVVFLSKYNLNLRNGYKVEDAVYNAGLNRFRPIVLTTLTTSLGLYPIIFEKSFQAQFLKPMAISLAYGVLIGTGFILMFFPVLILVLNDVKRFFSFQFKGIWLKPESVEKAIIDQQKKEIKEAEL